MTANGSAYKLTKADMENLRRQAEAAGLSVKDFKIKLIKDYLDNPPPLEDPPPPEEQRKPSS
jgi:hypothetical protein